MATDEIKEMLVDYNDGTTVKDWKRLSKKLMGPDKVEVRTFENTQNGDQFWVFGDAEDEAIHPAGDHYFFIGEADGELMAAFNPVSYWNKNKCLWDQHCGFYIETIYNIPSWIELDEACENSFYVEIPEDKTIDDVRAAFEHCGLIFDQSFHDFMESHL